MEKLAGSSKKLRKGARSKRNYKGARGKIKKEQGAKRDEKGAVKIGKKERVPKNGREQGEPPLTEPHDWNKLNSL